MKNQTGTVNRGLLLVVLVTVVLYDGRPILIPLFFAIMMAMLMAPVCSRLDNRGFHRIASALICVFILLVVFLGMFAIMVGQLSGFIMDLPSFEERATTFLVAAQEFIERKFDIPVADQTAFLKEQTATAGEFVRSYLTGVLRSTLQLLAGLIIMLVITFLILFEKEKYHAFFLRFVHDGPQQSGAQMLNSIGKVSQHYLVGRAVSIIILFILYAVALLIIGIENALMLAAVAALFNIIPYLGPILAALFPCMVALATEPDMAPAIWVLVSFCVFQAIDNYFVTPYFLGGEVSLSALSTIIAMICGGFIWGVAGMILFIPMVSILKIILDHIPGLEHYGALLGEKGQRPSQHMGAWFRKLFGRKRG